LNTLINDPNAPAEEMPMPMQMSNGSANSMADALGAGGSIASRAASNTIFNEDLLNHTLAQYPGGAEAFWEGMQGNGIGREEFMQMLASEMFVISKKLTNAGAETQFLKHQVNLNNPLYSLLPPSRLRNKVVDFRQTCNLNLLLSRLVCRGVQARDENIFR
jgi:hypothetical protein